MRSLGGSILAVAVLAAFASAAVSTQHHEKLAYMLDADGKILEKPPAVSEVLLAAANANASLGTGSSFRATWVPTQFYFEMTDGHFATLASLGVKDVFFDVWNNGRVFFNSPTMIDAIGEAGFAGDDFGTYSAMAISHGIRAHAWFEYGLMCGYGSNGRFCQYARQQGWTLGSENGFEWMNPNSNALAFLTGIMNDLANGYPGVTSLQLDDHFACPPTFGACSIETMNRAAANVSSSVRGRPLSIAPATRGFAYEHLNVDWVAWMDNGYFSQVVPQVYYASASQFEAELDSELAYYSDKAKYVVGVRVDGSGSNTQWDQVEAMLNFASGKGVGVCIWYAAGIVSLYPTQFATYW